MGRRLGGFALVVAKLTGLTVATVSGVATSTVAGAANPPLSITANPLDGAFVGHPYSTTLAATGGNAPYTWKIASGSPKPPKGLKLSKSTGVISGTPNKHAVTSTFTVEVLDTKVGKPKTQNTATATFTITIGITI